MPLFINAVSLADSEFARSTTWSADPGSVGGMPPRTYRIATPPPGKHSLDLCPGYEAEWRACVGDVVAALMGENRACVVWAQGPFESNVLLTVLGHVDEWNYQGLRYHVEGFTHRAARGYRETFVSFELETTVFDRLTKDPSINFETNRLSLVICAPGLVDSILDKRFNETGLAWILDNDAIAVCMTRHFEGCSVVAAEPVLDEVIGNVRKRFELDELGGIQ